ncbi:MAG: Unknown protein [uncultured Sulfurovum sp.]|uniref:Uncharacterized protein n=1 Tax=uncultured Sulfurovum sp. TaxID=269237 RepID=A0A6S6S884_9BACT|nr:MAG: Unknown protein [uncultured Sulfurovum sp.]
MQLIKQLLLITILSLTSLLACGPGNYYSSFSKENYYNFLDASLVGIEEENPLYALTSSGKIYTYDKRVEYYKEVKQQLNIEEWHTYLDGKLSQKELAELLYSDKGSLMERYKKYEKSVGSDAFKNYLAFIGKYDVDVMEKEQDEFLKLRYLFLNMRKQHYAGKYKEALALYAKYQASVSGVESIVHEWIDALRAGALQHLGQDVESNLLYGKVLENKTNAHLGYYDFKIENDAQWNALLAKTTTDEVKAKFYFLRALKWEGSPLLEHESMAKIAPNSVWFERLTYMLMQDFQEEAYSYEVAGNKNDKYLKKARKIYLLKEKRFLQTLASLQNPSFFSLYAQTYLTFLREGELDKKKMSSLSKIANKKEKKFIDILNYLEKSIHVNKSKQKALHASLEELSKEVSPALKASLFNYTALHNVDLYPSMSAKRVYSKIFTDNSYYSQVMISRDAISADSFEAYVEEKNRNFYEQKLFKKSMSVLHKDAVAETLAILNIKDGNFKKAQKYLEQVPKLNRRTEFNPFNVSFSGNNRKKKGKGYDQRKFVKTMLKLEEALEKNPTSAIDHFLYATGRYNTSWFGNFTESASIYRTLNGFDEEEATHILHNYKAIEKEYELALKYAKKEEFKAKISYQLLKIKLNKEALVPSLGSPWISFGSDGWNGENLKNKVRNSQVLKEAYGEYKKEYEDTAYGREIITQCLTFSYFH